jgi:hypothetical protein
MYTIQKNVPIPPATRGRGALSAQFPFADMTDVGDSFLVELSTAADAAVENKLLVRRVRQAALWAGRKYAPAKFTVRVSKEEGGVRVHRSE